MVEVTTKMVAGWSNALNERRRFDIDAPNINAPNENKCGLAEVGAPYGDQCGLSSPPPPPLSLVASPADGISCPAQWLPIFLVRVSPNHHGGHGDYSYTYDYDRPRKDIETALAASPADFTLAKTRYTVGGNSKTAARFRTLQGFSTSAHRPRCTNSAPPARTSTI